MSSTAAPANELAIWHDVECGAYHADLGIWEELAAAHPGPILELGAGTGRVALTLARTGHEVVGVDHAAPLLAELRTRAEAQRVTVEAVEADIRSLDLDREFSLVIAPMQVLQVLADAGERQALLRAIAAHLVPGGVGAAAIVEVSDEPVPSSAGAALLPDVREIDGWVYSSLPVSVGANGQAVEAKRLRQRVSPAGELDERTHVDRLQILDAARLDAEAAGAGLKPAGKRLIPSDELFVGATVCLWEASS
jgi:SAM-dependent methyltransferase